ncbi:hypothetical protein ACFQMM_20105 [Saliphagus sp. GCM10025308]
MSGASSVASTCSRTNDPTTSVLAGSLSQSADSASASTSIPNGSSSASPEAMAGSPRRTSCIVTGGVS